MYFARSHFLNMRVAGNATQALSGGAMANGRYTGKKRDSGRDGGGFIALPWSVIDSPAYCCLSVHARALLVEVARQYFGDNNGKLLLSRVYMLTRGWTSSDMLSKAKAELLATSLIYETVKGHFPKTASWYAITWQRLNRHPGFDTGAADLFVKGAYQTHKRNKHASLKPPRGAAGRTKAPPHGTETLDSVPPHGPMETTLSVALVPPHGHHLEMPSDDVGSPVSDPACQCPAPTTAQPDATKCPRA